MAAPNDHLFPRTRPGVGARAGVREGCRRRCLWVSVAVGAVQLLLLAAAIPPNQNNLNPDGIAYLRLASYYAVGNVGLALSGYWGPMLSWAVAILLKLGLVPLLAGRVAMALSAVVFAWGSRAVLRRLSLPPLAEHIGFALSALCSVYWSVEYISPDLLASGLLGFAASHLLRPDWPDSQRRARLAGWFFGLAYLAKAVALPLAMLATALGAVLWSARGGCTWRRVSASLAATWLACSLVVAPLVTILSVHYGRLTVSTSARIAHAVAGPAEVERYHPYARTFHQPAPGRVTAWEDPSNMAYRYWSPLQSWSTLQHQLRLSARNTGTALVLLGGFDLAHLGLVGLVACLVLALRQGEAGVPAGLWSAAWAGCLMAVYLPGLLQPVDQRYFYVAFPFLFGTVASLVAWLTGGVATWRVALAWVVGGFSFVSFLVPSVLGVMLALTGLADPASQCAETLAPKLERAGIRGPIAGSGLLVGGRVGLYVAFLTGQPWCGDKPNPTVDDWLRSGARLMIVNRRPAAVRELERDASFRSLDAVLFASEAEAAAFPLQVFEAVR